MKAELVSHDPEEPRTDDFKTMVWVVVKDVKDSIGKTIQILDGIKCCQRVIVYAKKIAKMEFRSIAVAESFDDLWLGHKAVDCLVNRLGNGCLLSATNRSIQGIPFVVFLVCIKRAK